MAYSAIWELQEALVSYLKTNALLGSAKLYDGQAPVGATAPYIVLGEPTETPANLHNRLGRSVTFLFHIWSEYMGNKEIDQLGNTLIGAIEHMKLSTIPGWYLVQSEFESANVIRESDGTRHGLYRFRLFLEAK